MYQLSYILFLFLGTSISNCSPKSNVTSDKHQQIKIEQDELDKYSRAYFASGCFWCVEAVFESVEGVIEVYSGYAGGEANTANYSDVSSGNTKHAESVEVYYDPKVISYNMLLVVFFGSQDPTTLNRQGPDAGTQYRSTIFYQNYEEKTAAEAYIMQLTDEKVFDAPITTSLEPLKKFYKAEEYHQDYEANHPNQSYVKAVSVPRLNKFLAKYPKLLKKNRTH